jgi:hypothetical protein
MTIFVWSSLGELSSTLELNHKPLTSRVSGSAVQFRYYPVTVSAERRAGSSMPLEIDSGKAARA